MAFGKNIKTISSVDQMGPYALYRALINRYEKAMSKNELDRTEEEKETINEYLGTKWYCTDPEGTKYHGKIFFRGVNFGGDKLTWNDPLD